MSECSFLPYERLQNKATRLEGTTKADEMLLAPDTGVAVIFEEEVLSEVSTVTFDDARNQLALSIDVMLRAGLRSITQGERRPERTSFVLITLDLFRRRETGLRGSRLYGWLMDGTPTEQRAADKAPCSPGAFTSSVTYPIESVG